MKQSNRLAGSMLLGLRGSTPFTVSRGLRQERSWPDQRLPIPLLVNVEPSGVVAVLCGIFVAHVLQPDERVVVQLGSVLQRAEVRLQVPRERARCRLRAGWNRQWER